MNQASTGYLFSNYGTGTTKKKKIIIIVAERLVINKRQWGGIGPCSKIGRNQYRSLTAQPKPRREGARILTRYSSLQTCRPSENCQCERLATPSTRATMQGLRKARQISVDRSQLTKQLRDTSPHLGLHKNAVMTYRSALFLDD